MDRIANVCTRAVTASKTARGVAEQRVNFNPTTKPLSLRNFYLPQSVMQIAFIQYRSIKTSHCVGVEWALHCFNSYKKRKLSICVPFYKTAETVRIRSTIQDLFRAFTALLTVQ
uniref:Uncharacterized protein n=1 Tax=Amphimedon queenslandica TaxID=400682 RepID=A0A1X7TT38_AMPQE